MTLTLKNIKKTNLDYKKAKSLLIRAFPPEERPPFSLLMHWAKKDCVDFLSAYDGDEWVGFIYIATYKDIVYVFLFAIEDNFRGHGYGSAILDAIKEKYKNRRIFLAIEEMDEKAANYPDRVRRYDFYTRNGFLPLNLKMREGRMIYDILTIGDGVTQKEYRALIDGFMGRFVRRVINIDLL